MDGLSSVPTYIVRNLSIVNGRRSIASRSWLEEHRAGRAPLDPPGDEGEERRRSTSSTEPTTTSIARLNQRDVRVIRTDGRPISGRPSIEWMPAFGPTASNSRGTMSICTSSGRAARGRARASLVRLAGEGDDHPVDVELARRVAGRSSGVPRIVRSSRSVRGSFGFASTKPTTLMPYSGCCRILRRDQLADVAGADDHRVLLVRDAAADDAARNRRGSNVTIERRDRPQHDDAPRSASGRTPPRRRSCRNALTVKTWKTPIRSPTVEWCASPRPRRRARRACRA